MSSLLSRLVRTAATSSLIYVKTVEVVQPSAQHPYVSLYGNLSGPARGLHYPMICAVAPTICKARVVDCVAVLKYARPLVMI